jgi:hypothetical protein
MNTRDDLPPETPVQRPVSVSTRLVRYAASRAPPGLTERLEEEWCAELAVQRGAIDHMCFALGCCWATQAIGRELQLYGARVNAAGHGSVGLIHSPGPSLFPRRAAVLLAQELAPRRSGELQGSQSEATD